MIKNGFVIAIDGPVASGKGTVASALARDLGGFHLYSGGVYRCIALLCFIKKIDIADENAVESILGDLDIRLEKELVFLNGENVTERIKNADTANGASVIGVYKKVREAGVGIQKRIADRFVKKGMIVVAEGRDMGTVVFPDAPLKIFLTARVEIRAKRRMEQYLQSGKDLDVELEELKKRDTRDTTRSESPLPVDPARLGYSILDNSDMNVEETVEAIRNELKKKDLVK